MRLKKICSITCALFFVFGFYSCKKDKSLENAPSYNLHVIPESIAKSIAQHFSINMLHQNQNTPARDSEYIPDREISSTVVINDKDGKPALYVFDYAENHGYIVISAEANLEPICAFVDEGNLNYENPDAPGGLIMWFQKTVDNIELIRSGKYDNSKNALPAWLDLVDNDGLSNLKKEISKYLPLPQEPAPDDPCPGGYYAQVGPLLTTNWNQGCTFNEKCPIGNCSGCNTHTLTGCVATAMSQVIKFWSPSNPYSYNYASMPNNYGNEEVQRLMYDAGVNVNMSWGCTGSGANDNQIPYALYWAFGFSGSATRTGYTSSSYTTVRDNLNHHWPVLLGGCTSLTLGIFPSGSCHEWVVDGYISQGNNCYGTMMFHNNWGWGGSHNGWFAFDNWNSGAGNFQYGDHYVHEVHP